MVTIKLYFFHLYHFRLGLMRSKVMIRYLGVPALMLILYTILKLLTNVDVHNIL